MEEAATPLPSEETTPPVTNIYFGAIRVARVVTRFTTPDFSYLSGVLALARRRIDVHTIMGMRRRSVKSNSLWPANGIFSASRWSAKHSGVSRVKSWVEMRAGAGVRPTVAFCAT